MAGKKRLTHGASASARGGRRACGAGLRSSESGCGEGEWAERKLGRGESSGPVWVVGLGWFSISLGFLFFSFSNITQLIEFKFKFEFKP